MPGAYQLQGNCKSKSIKCIRKQRSMQLRIKSWLLYIVFQIHKWISWTQTRQEQAASRPLSLYRGCNVLPMEVFIQCLCDEELGLLVIEGKASREQLQNAWIMILAEYYELKGEMDDEQWRLSRDVTRLQNHLMLLGRCVEFLKTRWSDSIAKSINDLGYSFRPPSKEDYWDELNRVVQKSKTKYVHLQQMIKELEIQVKKVEGKKPTRDYFDNMLIHIEEMQKVSYSLDTLTVQKFVLLEKKYWHQVELLKARAAKHGHRTH